ncbi:hypothetical protein LJR027_002064 [Terrabacter sp. LjRoot27]|uniref:hypothetical protein n=1 Tax=Terrabacter sp. LjRoot27 TaxID=3342306 RepID=UPI003ECDB3D8
MRPLTTADPVGTRVLYVGRLDASLDARSVADVGRADTGRVPQENHPGNVTFAHHREGLCVAFLGLENEAIAKRRFLADDRGVYPDLVVVGVDDWEAARSTGWWASLPDTIPEAG